MKINKYIALVGLALPLLTACNTTQTPVAPLAPIASPAPVAMEWSHHLVSGTKVDFTKLTPAVSNGQLFVVDPQGQITATNLNTGKPLWSRKIKGGISGGAETGNGAVYFPTTNGQLYALNAQTGEVQWHVALPDQSNTAPTYSAGQLYVKTIDDQLVSLNADNGEQKWSYYEGSTQLQLLGSSSAVIANNTVIGGFSDGKVAALNINDGQLAWQALVAMPQGFTDIGRMVGISANPVVSGSRVYVASYNGNISALDVSSGRVVWQHPLSVYAGIAVDNNAVYAADNDGTIWAFAKDDGAVLWKQTALAGRQLTGPAVTSNGLVIADNQGDIHWLSAQDGHFIARTSMGKVAITMTPVVTPQGIIVYANNGNVALFKA